MTHPSDRPPLHAVPNDDQQDLGRTPPHDEQAELAVLGGMLLDPTACETALDNLDSHDFYTPAHELIFDAITALYINGDPVDLITVANQLRSNRNLTRAGGSARLVDATTACVTPISTEYYAGIVATKARLRRIIETGTRLVQLGHTAADDTDLPDLVDQAVTTLTAVRPTRGLVEQAEDIDAFLSGTDPEYDWLVPGFLERQDRLILTASEGAGKSTLLRQWSIQLATGIHPFTGDRIDPVSVLVVDLENSRRQSRREYRPLRAAAPTLDPKNLRVVCRTEGLDLTTQTDSAWLDALLNQHKPDVLITGPVYKLAGGNPNAEEDAKPAALTIDALRGRHDIAVLLEAHSAKAPAGSKHRPPEPFGWSGWMRWPEFGLNLGPVDDKTGLADIVRWRGFRDRTRHVPEHLKRGGAWPWTVEKTSDEKQMDRICQAVRDAGAVLTQADIGQVVGIHQSSVSRLIGRYKHAWDQVCHEVQR